ALPVPETLVPPSNEIQETLVEIWKKILKVGEIGINSDFFQLGGNSIKALMVVSEINEAFDVALLITDIFGLNTIEEIAGYLADQVETSSAPQAIEPVEEREYYDVSHAQKRLWIICQHPVTSVAYNIPIIYTLKGRLNPDALQQAVEMLMERHESLRTVFISLDNIPKQKILEKGDIGFQCNVIDLRNNAHKEEEARELINEEAWKAFDLKRGPLLKIQLLRLEDETYLLFFNVHHIVSDGLSLGIMIKEMCRFYQAVCHGEENPLPPLHIQYKDFSARHLQQLAGESLKGHRDYWLDRFSGDIPQLELPIDHPRPSVKTYNGEVFAFLFPSGL
ncbi:MAG: hypothetical protein GY940_44175, partial [bacterium]|nr:hypothetical protein [bacterium]